MSAIRDKVRATLLKQFGLDGATTSEDFEARVDEITKRYEETQRRTAEVLEQPRPVQAQQSVQNVRAGDTAAREHYGASTPLIGERGAVQNDLADTARQSRLRAQTGLINAQTAATKDLVGGSLMEVGAQDHAATQGLLDSNIGYRDRTRDAVLQRYDRSLDLAQRQGTFDFLKDLALTGYMIFGD